MNDAVTRLTAALADRYRLERELGQGGMATVYLAEDLRHQRRVAIKVLKPELAAVLGAERFVQEITTTAQLQHPHILPLFDSGSADGFLYYVMPYIEGETLRARLDRERQLGVGEAVKITTEVADALDYAHRHGVIHRDIKPENILLHDSRPMVADFGIALALSAAAGGRMTETGLSLGTPHYMSPEQATAEKEITARSDVYSLASVLYEMLAGQPPHLGGSAQQIIMKIIAEPVAVVTSLRKSVPPNVAAALAKALEKLPADRFESAAAFGAALGNPGYTVATTALTPGVMPMRRRWLTTAALVVVALAAGMLIGRGRGDLGSVRPTDVVRASLVLGDSAGVRPIGNLRLAISPDGRRVAYVGADGQDNSLWIRDLDQPDARLLQDTKRAVAPFFSPDGAYVGFFSDAAGRMQLKVVPVGGGAVNTVLADSVASFGGGDWCDDGRIYFTHARLGLASVPAAGGAVTILSHPDSASNVREHDFPDVLPGCKYALIMAWGGTASASHTAVVDLTTGAAADLAVGTMARYAAPGHLIIGTSDGRILAAPFDPGKGRMTGAPVLLLQNVAMEGANGTVQFAISATGTLVYQPAAGTGAGLVWVDREGRRTLVDSTLDQVGIAMALSPDGRRIAFSRRLGADEQIWVKQLATGALVRVSIDEQGADRPTWTTDGQRVAYLGTRNDVRTAWVRRADGSDSARALAPGVKLDEITFDPLGRYTLFRTLGTNPGSRHLLVLQQGRDSAPRTLVESRFDNFAMTVSPNGRWLAYASSESGTPEVYVRPFPDVNAERFVISVGGGSEPLWSRDGRELFFRGPRGEVLVVPVTTTGQFQNGVPRKLFDGLGLASDPYHRSYDVTPDGRRFLMASFGGASGSALDLILNWRAELRRATAATR
jgi:eukaryotic-like serine/threonine-protein kinase